LEFSALLKFKVYARGWYMTNEFVYDRFDHLVSESGETAQLFAYDSVGNCLSKNEKTWVVNSLNQVEENADSKFTYDLNGNIKTQSNPAVSYEYDALNRLRVIQSEKNRVLLSYDAFGRCLSIEDNFQKKNLLYLGEQEIGSIVDGQLKEFRVVHPELSQDRTFAIEINEETYFPIQDFRGNICALQKPGGKILECFRYSAFGLKLRWNSDDSPTLNNPWCFANRREVESLILFTRRFYNENLMRWQTADPLGFKESLNLYRYLKNNPFCYKDLSGELTIELFLCEFGLEAVGVVAGSILWPTLAVIATAAVVYSAHQLLTRVDTQLNTIDEPIVEMQKRGSKPKERQKGKNPYVEVDVERLKDPTKCPADGFEWRGNGTKGSWVRNYNNPNQETLYPDLEHPPGVDPHWDYANEKGKRARLFLDGTWEDK
jgi:RHS repeat-associated protein